MDLDEQMIGSILAMKVDKVDFSKINEDKANKTELENQLDSINTLNKQMQHIVVLIIEMMKTNVLRGQDTE